MNLSERLVIISFREESGSELRIARIKVAQSSEDDFVRMIRIQIFEVLCGSNIPLGIKEDLISSEAKESFVVFNFISIIDLSVSIAWEFEHIAGNIVIGLEGLVIKSHPVSGLPVFLDIDEVWIVVHHLSNLNNYGLNYQSNKIYLI